jgi:hypothetical protein
MAPSIRKGGPRFTKSVGVSAVVRSVMPLLPPGAISRHDTSFMRSALFGVVAMRMSRSCLRVLTGAVCRSRFNTGCTAYPFHPFPLGHSSIRCDWPRRLRLKRSLSFWSWNSTTSMKCAWFFILARTTLLTQCLRAHLNKYFQRGPHTEPPDVARVGVKSVSICGLMLCSRRQISFSSLVFRLSLFPFWEGCRVGDPK